MEKKKLKFSIIFMILIVAGLVYGSGWHIANEVLSGTFLGDYQFNGTVSVSNPPTQSNHVVTKSYVDALSGSSNSYSAADSMTVWGTTTCPAGYTQAYSGVALVPFKTGTPTDPGLPNVMGSIICSKENPNSGSGTKFFWSDGPNEVYGDIDCAKCVKSNNDGDANFFVLINNGHSGNLGGIEGANQKCLTDLQTYNWLGKNLVDLNNATVKAFLCNSTDCNTLKPNSNYYFARSAYLYVGGASFRTDMYGRGPRDTQMWNEVEYFGSNEEYWTNYRIVGSTIWSYQPDQTSVSPKFDS